MSLAEERPRTGPAPRIAPERAREVAIETAPKGRTALVWSGTDLPGVQSGDVLPARWYKETLEAVGAVPVRLPLQRIEPVDPGAELLGVRDRGGRAAALLAQRRVGDPVRLAGAVVPGGDQPVELLAQLAELAVGGARFGVRRTGGAAGHLLGGERHQSHADAGRATRPRAGGADRGGAGRPHRGARGAGGR